MEIFNKYNKLPVERKIIIALFSMAFIVCFLLFFDGVQNFIISAAENIKHRNLANPSLAHYKLKILSCLGSALSVIVIICAALWPKLSGFTGNILNAAEKFLGKSAHRRIGGTSIKTIIIEQPFFLISFIFILYLLKNIFLVLQIVHADVFVILFALLLHIVLSFTLYRIKNKESNPVIHLAVCYGIIILSCLINAFIYDYSWDGQAYHQVAVIQLSNGWNPFYTILPESDFFWNNHYAKFTEMFASILLSVFKNIEIGKSYTMIFFAVTLCYALKYTSLYQKNKLAVLAISLIFAANPVVMSQIFTYYVDSFLGMCLITLVFACMDYERQQRTGGGKDLFIIIAVCVFAINTKFTGFICGIVLISYVVKQLVMKNYKKMFALILSGIAILLVGSVFTGYNPYITNFKNFGHPFYPLNNDTSLLYSTIMSEKFLELHPVLRSLSLFFINYDLNTAPFNPAKLFYSAAAHRNYCRVTGGFGLLFVEICVFSGLILLFTIKEKKSTTYKKILFPASLLLVLAVITPINWLARYIPYFWYLFAFLIMTADYTTNKNKNLFYVLFMLVCINSGTFFIGNAVNGIVYTDRFDKFASEVKQCTDDTIHVALNENYFKYVIREKMKRYDIEKEFVFSKDDTVYPNGVRAVIENGKNRIVLESP
ncbi:MAG: hypothetical protein LBD07_03940 [Spirochaetaceae bacterium]|jgi:hypothetical protein|nr:hypothetical protein [Spirochaetaceae bacterium]